MRLPNWLRRFVRTTPYTTSTPAIAAQMGGTSVYAGGQVTRLTSDWVTTPLSIDRETRYDLSRLRARARDLVRNAGYPVRFLALLQDNVVGHHGIVPDVDTGDTGLDQQIESAWRQWGHAETCAVDGKLSWLDTERLVIRSLAVDGELILRLIRGADNDFGLALQCVDPDLLDQNYNRLAGGSANEIRMGIERDQWGRPLAYHLWTFHPQDYDFAIRYGERKTVPAGDVLHPFIVTRAGQTRGLTWFAPILLNAQMLRGYAEAAVTGARIAAASMAVLSPDKDAQDIATPLDDPNAGNGRFEMEAEPGVIKTVPPGYTLQPFLPDQPSGEFSAFTKAMLREIASGLGVSYNAMANDLESVNYSSMRAGTLADRDSWRVLQTWMVEHVHRRIFGEWLKMAILAGALPATARKALVEDAVEWKPRGYPWVDPLKDSEADVLRIQNGLESRHSVLAEEGREFEDVLAELADEKTQAETADVVIESAVKTPKSPPPDTEEAAGDGATAPAAGNGNGKAKNGKGKPREAVIEALRAGRDGA